MKNTERVAATEVAESIDLNDFDLSSYEKANVKKQKNKKKNIVILLICAVVLLVCATLCVLFFAPLKTVELTKENLRIYAAVDFEVTDYVAGTVESYDWLFGSHYSESTATLTITTLPTSKKYKFVDAGVVVITGAGAWCSENIVPERVAIEDNYYNIVTLKMRTMGNYFSLAPKLSASDITIKEVYGSVKMPILG